MMNLYGGQGLGSNGLGMSSGGQMNPMQMLSMLHGQGGGAQPPTTPFQQGGGMTPMSNYIGSPQPMGGMAGHPMMPPVAGNPGPQGMAQMGGQNGTAGLMQLLAQLKGGQTGVAPTGNTPGGVPGGGNPMGPGMMAGPIPSGAGGPGGGVPMAPGGAAGAMGNPSMMDWLRQMMAAHSMPQDPASAASG